MRRSHLLSGLFLGLLAVVGVGLGLMAPSASAQLTRGVAIDVPALTDTPTRTPTSPAPPSSP